MFWVSGVVGCMWGVGFILNRGKGGKKGGGFVICCCGIVVFFRFCFNRNAFGKGV